MMSDDEIWRLIELRHNAKVEIREIDRRLQEEGVTVTESPHATTWTLATPADRQGFEPFEYTERS